MSYIVASLPPMKCFVKREFLYNDHKGHGELEPAVWVSLKALRGHPWAAYAKGWHTRPAPMYRLQQQGRQHVAGGFTRHQGQCIERCRRVAHGQRTIPRWVLVCWRKSFIMRTSGSHCGCAW